MICYAAYDIDQITILFEQFISFLRHELLISSVLIFLLYIFSVILAFPIMYISVGLGYAFSQVFSSKIAAYSYGLSLITVSIIAGGVGAFLVSRYWLSRTIKRRCLSKHRSFIAINHVISRQGWKTVMLLRLTPFPFALVSYLLGVTSVKLAEFILGSGIMAVHVAIWLYIGQTLNHFQEI